MGLEKTIIDVAGLVRAGPGDLDRKIEAAIRTVVEELGADGGGVLELDGDELSVPYHHFPQHSPSALRLRARFPWTVAQIERGNTVGVASLSELPAEAAEDRRSLQEAGVVSYLVVPVFVGGAFRCAVGLAASSVERQWPRAAHHGLMILGEIIAGARIRRRSEQQLQGALARLSELQASLEEQLGFEKLIAEVSGSLVRPPGGDTLEAIGSALGRIMTYLDADRASLIEYVPARQEAMMVCSRAAPGFRPAPLGRMDLDRRMLARTHHAAMDGLAMENSGPGPVPGDGCDLRDVFRRLLGQAESPPDTAKSTIGIPVALDGVVVCTLAFSFVTRAQTCPRELLLRLRSFCEVFANALLRRRAEQEASELHERLKDRLRFEELVAELLTSFVQFPERSLEEMLQAGLSKILSCMQADWVLLTLPLRPHILTAYRFADGRSSPILDRAEVPGRLFPWCSAILRSHEPVEFCRLEDLPPEAAEDVAVFRELGTAAVIAVPLEGSQVGVGAIGLARAGGGRAWPEATAQRLRMIGDVMVKHLLLKHNETQLRQALTEVETLKNRLEAENLILREQVQVQDEPEIIGQSEAVRWTLAQALQVARTESTVLLLGETGTGKELLANTIHRRSSRARLPMVKVNCAAIPAGLVESELFGHERGAFTGALSRRVGRFEAADGSTLFLDEVSELPLEVQAKLLRVLQEGQFERVGSSKSIRVDVRLIAASNHDLAGAVKSGRFRADLYYRLNVFPLRVPPLRERLEDIPLLVGRFVEEFSASMGKTVESVRRTSLYQLQSYRWPGNVRELKNVVERAMILCDGPSLRVDAPRHQDVGQGDKEEDLTLAQVERGHIIRVLDLTGWRIRGPSGAAALLGLKPTTLEARMVRLGIKRLASNRS